MFKDFTRMEWKSKGCLSWIPTFLEKILNFASLEYLEKFYIHLYFCKFVNECTDCIGADSNTLNKILQRPALPKFIMS